MGGALTKATLLAVGVGLWLPGQTGQVQAFRSHHGGGCGYYRLDALLPTSLRRQRCHGTEGHGDAGRTSEHRIYLNFNNFSDNAVKVLMLSQEEARRASLSQIATRHIFQGLVCLDSGLAAHILREFDVTVKKARDAAEADAESDALEVQGRS